MTSSATIQDKVKVLLVYPSYPDTFWSFKHSLRIVKKKAAFPPLGLLTVAAMLPEEWDKKLVDMNVKSLRDDDIKWADYIFMSAMVVQRQSAREIVDRCRRLGTKVVAGGPFFTAGYEDFADIDHLVLDEAEVTLPLFLEDLGNDCAKHVYTSKERPDLSKTPRPMWSLVDLTNYSTMSIQYSRGCPFDCEFCDIIVLNGNKPRTKSKEQVIGELDDLYRRGWREGVFVVDDNFIGNKKKLKREILPAIIEWQERRKHPFGFLTEASINLADDEQLMDAMARAGFDTVFVGIETPNEESLVECNKVQNRKRDLVDSVKTIQNHGMQVQGGFILGFDSDPVSIFRSQISFIQRSGIVTAMVGLLNAPKGTKLYQRLKNENRLLDESNFSGNNTDCSLNFVPRMDRETLLSGYRQILETIYAPRTYYERIRIFLSEYRPQRNKGLSDFRFWRLKGFIRSMWFLGVLDRARLDYWRFFFWALLKKPRSFPLSMSLAVHGFHFRTVLTKYARTTGESSGSHHSLTPSQSGA